MALKNEVGWSPTRIQTLNDCSRKYFYQYYGSWGGWSFGSSDETKETYRLKKLKTIPLLISEITRDLILKVLRSEIQVIADVEKIYTDTLKKELANLDFLEREYQTGTFDDDISKYKQKGLLCLKQFFSSKLFSDIKLSQTGDHFFCPKYTKVIHSDIPIWVSFDFAYRNEADVIRVLRFKTSEHISSSDTLEFMGPVIYFLEKIKCSLENLEFEDYYLFNGLSSKKKFTRNEMDSLLEVIKQDFDRMKEIEPSKKDGKYQNDTFEKTTNHSKCKFCNFRKVCKPLED